MYLFRNITVTGILPFQSPAYKDYTSHYLYHIFAHEDAADIPAIVNHSMIKYIRGYAFYGTLVTKEPIPLLEDDRLSLGDPPTLHLRPSEQDFFMTLMTKQEELT